MIIRIVKMTFRPDCREDFRNNFEQNKQHIRDFPGCERLLLLQDIADERVFFTYSWWRGEEDLERYRQSDLFQTVWSYTKTLFAERAQAWSVTEVEALR